MCLTDILCRQVSLFTVYGLVYVGTADCWIVGSVYYMMKLADCAPSGYCLCFVHCTYSQIKRGYLWNLACRSGQPGTL